MAQNDEYGPQLGVAWAQLRGGAAKDAITGFQQILQSAPNHMDAIYGLGLAQGESGQLEAARATLQRCLELVNKGLEDDPGSDRYEILERMVQQRMSELNSK